MEVVFITNIAVVRGGDNGKIIASFEAITEQDLPAVPSKGTVIVIGDMYGAVVHEVRYDIARQKFSVVIGDYDVDPDSDCKGILRFTDWSLEEAKEHMEDIGFKISNVNIKASEPKNRTKVDKKVDPRGVSQTEGWAEVIRPSKKGNTKEGDLQTAGYSKLIRGAKRD